MKHVLIVVMALSWGVSARAEDKSTRAKPPPSTPDVKAASVAHPTAPSHEGVWKPVAAVLGGVRLPAEAVKAVTLKIRGDNYDNYEVTVEGEAHADKGTFTLDTITSLNFVNFPFFL